MPEKKKPSKFFLVRGVDDETRKSLRALSIKRYGKANASQFVRDLIHEKVQQEGGGQDKPDLSSPMRRFQISVPQDCYDQMKNLADEGFSTPQFFVAALIYQRLGVPQLLNNEVEVLRSSNYQLAKIGANVNQIAKAFNQLVMTYQGKDKLPPIGREMDKLKKTIKDHTDLVLNVLERGTVVMETRGRGTGNEKRKATLEKKTGGKKTISRTRK